jgi:single-stranded-DNA-specific exonuclease
VVIDHHQTGEHLPNAQAVVNPNRQDDLSGLGYLAAVGVTFLLVVAVNRLLRDEGRYANGLPEPDLLELLDLVALGTVCDVVPLVGLNRALVAQGLKVMGRRGNIGLAALGEAARLARRPDTFCLGFLLGPRINAAGRMGNAGLGAELLSTQDSDRARSIAGELEKLNGLRRDEEAAVLDAALMQAERSLGHDLAPPAVVVAGDGWHPGVIGIVAGRLKEQFNRPAVVVAFDKPGRGTGSGRSIAGVDLGSAVRAAAEAGVLVRGGGHAMAAGLTIERARIGDFRAFLEEALAIDVGEATALPGLSVDGAMSAGGATPDFIRLLEDAGPYGTGNPRPRFAFPAHRISYCELVGTDHVRCTIQGGDGARLKAIAFRAARSPLGSAMLKRDGVPVHIVGHLSLNEWGGKVSAQLIVEDIAAVR